MACTGQRRRQNGAPLNFARRRSEVNRSSIHKEVIGYVFARLGDDAYSPARRHDPILKDAQARYRPSIDARTLRRWYVTYDENTRVDYNKLFMSRSF
jgi:hypothetical protein